MGFFVGCKFGCPTPGGPSSASGKPERPWRDIVAEAARASRENNLERLADLRRELESVLAHGNEGVRAEATSDNNLPTQRKTA